MLKLLKKKFILVNMLLALCVMITISVVNILSLTREFVSSYESALNAEATRGDSDNVKQDFNLREQKKRRMLGNTAHILSFSITKNSAGEWIVASPFVNVDDASAALLVEQALGADDAEGFLLRYGVAYARGDDTIAFVNMQTEFAQLTYNIGVTGLIFVAALAAFFLISLFLSTWALKPVAKAWEQQQRFVADASHELKTPLTVILANTDIMKSELGDNQWLTNTKNEALRMKSLVEDMLFLARTDSLRQPAPKTPVSLSDIVWESILSFEVVAYERSVSMESDIASGCTTSGSDKQLKQLVLILLDNAVKYTSPQGKVSVRLYPGRERLHLAVQNSGDPIPASQIGHLFERFYRADSARTHGGGYGLGLAIAKEIVELHHGKIVVQSSEETGTVFSVALSKIAANEKKPAERASLPDKAPR